VAVESSRDGSTAAPPAVCDTSISSDGIVSNTFSPPSTLGSRSCHHHRLSRHRHVGGDRDVPSVVVVRYVSGRLPGPPGGPAARQPAGGDRRARGRLRSASRHRPAASARGNVSGRLSYLPSRALPVSPPRLIHRPAPADRLLQTDVDADPLLGRRVACCLCRRSPATHEDAGRPGWLCQRCWRRESVT
jgi:hypothetical protein